MPSNVVKSLAEKSGKSVEEVETLWSKAKKQVQKDVDEKSPRFYPMVVGTLKKMLGIK